jgi:hypothetical protein
MAAAANPNSVGRPVGNLDPGAARVVAAMHADVVLLVHALRIGAGANQLVDAEPDLLVLARPVGAQTLVAGRPARPAVGRLERADALHDRPPVRRVAVEMIAEMPRCPGGWLAGSSHASLPGWPASVVRSDQFSPPSVLSKMPGASTPTSTRRPHASDETFDTLRVAVSS